MAVHRHRARDRLRRGAPGLADAYDAYFDAVERIVAPVGGRPHWGKLHTLGAERLAELYPRMADVRRVRAAPDPVGVFANAYVDRVLGPVVAS